MKTKTKVSDADMEQAMEDMAWGVRNKIPLDMVSPQYRHIINESTRLLGMLELYGWALEKEMNFPQELRRFLVNIPDETIYEAVANYSERLTSDHDKAKKVGLGIRRVAWGKYGAKTFQSDLHCFGEAVESW